MLEQNKRVVRLVTLEQSNQRRIWVLENMDKWPLVDKAVRCLKCRPVRWVGDLEAKPCSIFSDGVREGCNCGVVVLFLAFRWMDGFGNCGTALWSLCDKLRTFR